MLENQDLAKLYFELASESRLSILQELQSESLKMQEIARRLDVTATEAFRQLERLSGAMLVQRQSDGRFALSEYGKLVLQISGSFEFVSKHKGYFSTHDLIRLPVQFVNRLGELSQANLTMDTVETLNKVELEYKEAEEYAWGIAEGTIPDHMAPVMNERLQKGTKMRFMIPANRLLATQSTPTKGLEIRSLIDIPAIVVLTEKMAGICFRQIGGRVDYAGFFGSHPTFHNWVKELFLYYWENGKRI